MSMFERLGEKVERFKQEAVSAREESADYRCRNCENEIYSEQETCPECGSPAIERLVDDDPADEKVQDGEPAAEAVDGTDVDGKAAADSKDTDDRTAANDKDVDEGAAVDESADENADSSPDQ